MIKTAKSAARARSMMAPGNPVPPDAYSASWSDELGQATMTRILAEPGEPAAKRPGRVRQVWLGQPALPEPARRPVADSRRSVRTRRWLIPAAAAAAVAAIAVTAALLGQQAGSGHHGKSPTVASRSHASVVATINVGWLPFGVAVDSATSTVYVTNTFGSGIQEVNRGSVSVISAQTNKVTSTIKVQSAPHGIAVNPQTDTIYVANEQANHPQGSPKHGSVSVIDGHANKVTATVRVGTAPSDIAVDAQTDTIYVTNYGNNTVSVIDGHTSKITATIKVGREPSGIAVDQLTDTIYVVDQNDNAVSVIDGHTNKVTATVKVGSLPLEVAVNAQTDSIYVTNSIGGNTVSVIDGHTNKVTATITVGKQPQGIAVDPGTNTIYVINTTGLQKIGTVMLIDGATNKVIATVPVGKTPQGVDVNPATGRAYVTNEFDQTVSVIGS